MILGTGMSSCLPPTSYKVLFVLKASGKESCTSDAEAWWCIASDISVVLVNSGIDHSWPDSTTDKEKFHTFISKSVPDTDQHMIYNTFCLSFWMRLTSFCLMFLLCVYQWDYSFKKYEYSVHLKIIQGA